MEELIQLKKSARSNCKKIISEISADEWKRYGKSMSEKLIASEIWKSAQTVFCFVSMKQEPDTSLIIKTAIEQGKKICVPRIIREGIMEAVLINSTEELVSATMGILEPKSEMTQKLKANQISLAVVPCMAASEKGTRLGKGGGYYDRFLAQFNGISVVLCAEELLLKPENLPVDRHDISENYVITQKKVITCDKK